MLVDGYSLRMAFPDCNYSAETPNAIAELSGDIGEALPYLNAVLKGARYSPQAQALTITHEGHRIVLRPRQVAISRLEGEEEARRIMDWLVEIINRVWENRASIQPNHQPAREPALLDVYRLLPGGNCRACGEATCLAFAAKLLRGDCTLDACPPLAEARYSGKREALLDLLDLPQG